MFLRSDFDFVSHNATRDEVIDLIDSLGQGENSIALLGSAVQVYIQTNYMADTDRFGLDYRAGGPGQHYETTVTSKELVMSAFLSYLAGDNQWRTMVEWKRDTHYEAIQG
ncbi:hypothetical protein AB0K52_20380 [Glycomyces sp. NPDC049804]|uniref:hypothetical protein n=1 Tax=Glycomyces sp. NPDC049804 TaxID=3154363 RepID=UPI00341D2A7F